MTPDQVKSLFRIYIDEPDVTFVTDDNIITYLDAGYREFRNIVSDICPTIYETFVSYDPASPATELDLAATSLVNESSVSVRLLGASQTAGANLVRLLRISEVNSDGDHIRYLNPVNNVRSLSSTASSYALVGTKIQFGQEMGDKYRIHYVPGSLTWSSLTFIDDLDAFHDLIALLASKQYFIQDGGMSQPLMIQMQDRLARFEEYLRERADPETCYVQVIDWFGGY